MTSVHLVPCDPYLARQTVTCPGCAGNGRWHGFADTTLTCGLCGRHPRRGDGTLALTSGGRMGLVSHVGPEGRGELIAVLEGDVAPLIDDARMRALSRQGGLLVLDAIPGNAPSLALACEWARLGFHVTGDSGSEISARDRRHRRARAVALYALDEACTPTANRHLRMLRDAARDGVVSNRHVPATRVAKLPAITVTAAQLDEIAHAPIAIRAAA